MSYLDLTIIAAYLAGTVLFGAWFTRRQRDLKYYFVSDRNLPWWVVMASIVSTETSAVTFISVPGYAFSTDFTFLQLPLGYVVGRFVVSLLFVPAYFRGEVLTVYQLLGDRFGGAVKQLASGLFLATRTLSDGFRLFATSLVLGALFLALARFRRRGARLAAGCRSGHGIPRRVGRRPGRGDDRLHLPWRHDRAHLDRRHPAGDLSGRGRRRHRRAAAEHPGRGRRGHERGLGAGEASRLRLRLRRHPRLHLLVRRHRRRVPDHRDTRHRPVHGATLPVQPIAGRRAQGAAGQRRVRAGAVLHLPGHRPAALRVLHGTRRGGAWRPSPSAAACRPTACCRSSS